MTRKLSLKLNMTREGITSKNKHDKKGINSQITVIFIQNNLIST